MNRERGRGQRRQDEQKKQIGKTKENIEFSKDLFWLAVVAARLPVVTQLDPKFRLYFAVPPSACRACIPLTLAPSSFLCYRDWGVADTKCQMKFHCKQTCYGKLSSLNKFPLSSPSHSPSPASRMDNSPGSVSIRILCGE